MIGSEIRTVFVIVTNSPRSAACSAASDSSNRALCVLSGMATSVLMAALRSS